MPREATALVLELGVLGALGVSAVRTVCREGRWLCPAGLAVLGTAVEDRVCRVDVGVKALGISGVVG